jgi:hypothetical protein
MAELKKITTWGEAEPHLRGLRDTIPGDIEPLLRDEAGAPFAVCREVFSYVDYLGALHSGRTGVRDRFVAGLQNLFAHVDSAYRDRANELYDMYRNGTVHQFRPKILRNQAGQELHWLNYRGERRGQQIDLAGQALAVSHLAPLPKANSQNFWLAVGSDVLVADLKAAIDLFIASPSVEHQTRVAAWNSAASRFLAPHIYEFSV